MISVGFINVVLNGILEGGLYGILASGLAISFGLLDIVNLAHPTFIILSSYIILAVSSTLNIYSLFSTILIIPLFFLLGVGVYKLINETVLKKETTGMMHTMVFFFGIIFIVQVSLLYFFGVKNRFLTPMWPDFINLSFFSINTGYLIAFIASLFIFVAVHYFLKNTYLGLSIKAVGQNEMLTRTSGVQIEKTKSIGFGMSIALATVAGFFWGTVIPFTPSSGLSILGLVVAIVVLGGLGSIKGCLIGGILIALSQSLTSYFWNPNFIAGIPFAIIILIFFLKPSGLFGKGIRT